MSSTDGQDLKHDGDQRIEYIHNRTTDVCAAEEALGTIIVAEKDRDSRSAWRPQPSLDPDDPLVSLEANPCYLKLKTEACDEDQKLYLRGSSIELASLGEVHHSCNNMLLLLFGDRQCQ